MAGQKIVYKLWKLPLPILMYNTINIDLWISADHKRLFQSQNLQKYQYIAFEWLSYCYDLNHI